MAEFAGKRVLVTGGAQGIGRAVARAFLEQGARVAIVDLDAEALAEAAADLSGRGEVLALAGDVAAEADVRRCAAAALAAFGGLDALVCNAGVMQRKPLAATTLEDWNRVLGVNLTGAFLCVRECAAALAESRGSVVSLASTRAYMSEPDTVAYAASKGGLVGLTHALAVSLGPAVRVNAIAPGWIDVTGLRKSAAGPAAALSAADHAQHPVGRVGRPEDVAELALFLCSPRAGFMTGQCLVLDGGMTRRMLYVE
jgi:NAD(P)-dependent dehydrogenase (short-subunit alcohol dehydrogenase family)